MVDVVHLALAQARDSLAVRAHALARDLETGRDVWGAYLETVTALVQVDAHLRELRGEHVLTSKELGQRFKLSAKVAAKKARNGTLPGVTPIPIGRRIRWKATS